MEKSKRTLLRKMRQQKRAMGPTSFIWREIQLFIYFTWERIFHFKVLVTWYMSVTGILLEHPEVCYLSKCQYIISTLYQKLYVWHSYPPPTRPCLQQIKLKDRKVIFPYLVCILVDLVPEQIVLSTREGKERQGPAPSQRSWCSAGAGTEPVGAWPQPGEGGREARAASPTQFRAGSRGGVQALLSEEQLKAQHGLKKGLSVCTVRGTQRRAQIKTGSMWAWAVLH